MNLQVVNVNINILEAYMQILILMSRLGQSKMDSDTINLFASLCREITIFNLIIDVDGCQYFSQVVLKYHFRSKYIHRSTESAIHISFSFYF